MIRHLFKIVWNRKRSNFLVTVEIALSFLVVYAVFTFGAYYADNYSRPLGFSYENVWDVELGGPLLLVAGGSGICPLMAMIRHRAARGSRVPTRLLYSSRSLEDVIYRAELDRLAGRADGLEVLHTLTRSRPGAWHGYARRIDRAMLAEAGFPPEQRPLCMVCGPTPLVEAVASTLVALGHPPDRVKTERFGPTGG